MKRILTLLLMIPTLLFSTASFADQTCSVPKVLIVLDKSSSMITGKIGNDSKWQLATDAITNVVNNFDGRIDFGLMIYPGTNHCTTGQVVVDVAPGTTTDIIAALQDPPPSGGNYTPMYQSLDAVASYTPLQDPSSENYVIFLTDGWQYCLDENGDQIFGTRFYAVDSVSNLAALNISTAVIGFSSSVDTVNLQRMAIQGNMTVSTCDPNASVINDSNRCYFQADNSTELLNALNNIALQITAEQCDGIDNNCDGNIDEGLFRSCSTACGNGMEQCENGVWVGCTAPEPHPEICDDIDNDCDGETDEGCSCRDGQTKTCGKEDGICEYGYQLCENGVWSECRDAIWPQQETCNGVDDDCDGFTDENLSQECETACGVGYKTCVNGDWSECSAPQPHTETCNAQDDDCNGIIDDGDALCPSGQECIEGVCVDQNSGNNNDGGTGDSTDIGEGEGGTGTAPDGCSCHIGASPSSSSENAIFFVLMIFGTMILFRRRSL